MSRRCPRGKKFDGRRCIEAGIIVKQTYNIVTEESAREGDFAESGWVDKKGKRFENTEEVIEYLKREGADEPSASAPIGGVWYSTGFQTDYRTGEREEREDSYHIYNATEREERRIFEQMTKKKFRRGQWL